MSFWDPWQEPDKEHQVVYQRIIAKVVLIECKKHFNYVSSQVLLLLQTKTLAMFPPVFLTLQMCPPKFCFELQKTFFRTCLILIKTCQLCLLIIHWTSAMFSPRIEPNNKQIGQFHPCKTFFLGMWTLGKNQIKNIKLRAKEPPKITI